MRCAHLEGLSPDGVGGMQTCDANRLLFLRIALIVTGLACIFGFYPLSIVWPSGCDWGHGHSHYLLMTIGVYATLGVFLLIASRDPYAHKSVSGLPCGRALFTARSWLLSPSVMERNAAI